jgi:GNAT superfamily N-acetyltransferase
MRSGLAGRVAQTIVRVRALKSAVADGRRVSFHRVAPAELEEVGAFRRRYYATTESAYLLDQLDARGLDEMDRRAFVYAAKIGGRVVASLRALPAPFELDHHVPRPQLQAAIGASPERYLEVSRMLVAPELAGRGLGSATVGFAGIDVLMHTSYRGYFAYIRLRPHERAALPGKQVMKFQIPERGDHQYTVVAGGIGLDTLWRGVGRVRAAAGRRPLSLEHAC